jgi:hypothetical protein
MTSKLKISLLAICTFIAADAAENPQCAVRYRNCVGTCLDRLIEKGTDRYGPVQTPMIMSLIDVRTGDAPREPELLDGWVRSEERPGRRNPGGCDLWDDQPLIQVLGAYGTLTGNPRYQQAADDYIKSFVQRARKPNGLFAWGSHLFYNAYTDQIDDDRHGNPHEILIHLAEWDTLWRLEPEAVKQEIEGIWTWHVANKTTGQHNRHDDGQPGCDFAFSGGSLAHAFAFLHSKTGQREWLDRAKLVANWHWSHRNPQTNLPPDAPSTGDRYDARTCFTTIPGPHAGALLKCTEITGDPYFRDIAVAYVKAWLKYAWDEPAGKFYAALQLDGKPVAENERGTGYDAWMPTGYADTWPTTMYSYEFPLGAAQTCICAFEQTSDPLLLDGARKWARHIRADMPPTIGRRWRNEICAAMPEAKLRGGAYAEGYGRAILFFTHLYRSTRDAEDLATAQSLADEAINRLFENGWVKGHAGKPYYEATDGTGTLLCALLELANVIEPANKPQ